MLKRVLITGAHGFVGQHVQRELCNYDYELVTPSRKELDLVLMNEFNEGWINHSGAEAFHYWLFDNEIDAIVHLAATCGGIGINKDNPGKFIYDNLQMGINVLEGARMADIKKVVNLGTVCAYPKFTPTPFKEENIWDGYPEETNAPYGIAKKTIVEMGRAYSQQYGMDITNLIPTNMYGEGDDFDLYSSHVIPALIRKFEETRTHNDSLFLDDVAWVLPVELWGTGSASREFMHASDCARAIAVALQKNTGPDPINLGTGKEITIADLAELIRKVGNYDIEITWDSSKPDGQPRRSLDVTRAKNVLKWQASVDLEEGLRRTIKWYRQQ